MRIVVSLTLSFLLCASLSAGAAAQSGSLPEGHSPSRAPVKELEHVIPSARVLAGPVGLIRPAADLSHHVVRVYYATDRRRGHESTPSTFYGAGRGQLEIGRIDVTVPGTHRTGLIETPGLVVGFLYGEKPIWHMCLRKPHPLARTSAMDSLHEVTRGLDKRALVFIHGFNVDFADAALRAAQLAYDLQYPGVVILYSWPSDGKASPLSYTADEADAEWTTAHLVDFLRELTLKVDLDRVDLIAHSMGNRVALGAMRELTMGGFDARVHHIISAAPDVDADVYRRTLVPSIREKVGSMTLYASSRDFALILSRRIHASPRAGESGPSLVVIDGVSTIDVSLVASNFLGHSVYAEASPVINDLFNLLRNDLHADKRRLQKATKDGRAYWIFPRN